MGLLRLMQSKQAFPFANPIEFTWRELMDTIGIAAGGRSVDQLKKAIRSIEGTRIRSKFALKNADNQHLKSRERGYGLYSEFVFCDELMPDNQTIASKNFIWLADWYLANINSLYCSPIDHTLWQQLDDSSPIASRLYEFFTFNFSGVWPTLTIDYEKLCRFLPVAAKTHLSQIEQQFGPALSLIINAGILADANWQKGKRGQPQLTVRRGPCLTKKGPSKDLASTLGEIESTEIHELYREQQPHDELVCQFHALWSNDTKYRPTNAERTLSREILNEYGEHAEKLLPRVVELMRVHFPGAKSFGGTKRYWPDAAQNIKRELAASERRTKEFIEEEVQDAKARQDKANLEQWQLDWNRLPASEQDQIRQFILSTTSPSMRLEKHPHHLHRFCLRELGKRQQSQAAA